MGSNPSNPDFRPAKTGQLSSEGTAVPSRREALQALLAFSAFHQQVRQRRGEENGGDVWELDQFVLDEVLHLVAERALSITGADGTAIALSNGQAIICRASVGTVAPDRGARISADSGFAGACLSMGRVVRCDDSETDPRVNVEACRTLGTRSMLAVPLLVHGNVAGLIEAFSTEAYAFNDTDVRSLSLLAELILAALRFEEEDRAAEFARQSVDSRPLPSADVAGHYAQPETSASAPPPTEYSSASAALDQLFSLPFASEAPLLLHEVEPPPSRSGAAVLIVMVLLAVSAGWGIWWKIRQRPSAVSASTRQGTLQSANPSLRNAAATETLATSTGLSGTGVPEVTGLRHWSSTDSSAVAIELTEQVAYEAHRISDPDRIYFDLPDTALAQGIANKIIEVRDTFLERVRIAQPVPGTTRVVLETKAPSEFSVSLEQNPYRLIVEVHKPGSPSQASKMALAQPTEQPPKPMQELARPATAGERSALNHAAKLRIVIDAGHGGWDLGTVGQKGLLEKDLVLDIVGRVGRLVEDGIGAEVVYTRASDTYISLEKRTELANIAKADLFLSVHANYSDLPTARGVETYFTNTYNSVHARTAEGGNNGGTVANVDWTNIDLPHKVEESRKFAACVQQSLVGMLAAKNPEIRNRGVKKASYIVLTGTTMPAVLTEVSFVSSPRDETALLSPAYRQQIAEAIYKGVDRYIKESRRVKFASAARKTTG